MTDTPARICRRCGRPVEVEADRYGIFEQMHYVCFHYEFEHDPADPDEECAAGGCPSAAIRPRPGRRPPVDRRQADVAFAEDALQLISFDLSDAERDLFRCGLREWGGPARCTSEMATAMGFQSEADVFAQRDRLTAAINAGEPLSRFDWCRVLLATEIVFASDVVGSGRDWSITTGLSDEETIALLRGVQRKLTREVRGLLGNGFGTRSNPLPP